MEQAIHTYLRAVVRQRATLQIGPFLAAWSRYTTNPYLNYAIPDDGAAPSAADIAALIREFRGRQRMPRFEYIPQLAPLVEPVLLAAGFVVESRPPLMVFPTDAEPQAAAPEGIVLRNPASEADWYGVLGAQNEAYGEGAPSPEDVTQKRQSAQDGEITVLAALADTGAVVAGGVCTTPIGGVSEIAGVGVRAAYRRRGIAAALTAELVRHARAAGVSLPFLMAAGEDEARIYRRVGLRQIGEILHISLPDER